jgi:hypothetical protein
MSDCAWTWSATFEECDEHGQASDETGGNRAEAIGLGDEPFVEQVDEAQVGRELPERGLEWLDGGYHRVNQADSVCHLELSSGDRRRAMLACRVPALKRRVRRAWPVGLIQLPAQSAILLAN